jgi:hypothetical protein
MTKSDKNLEILKHAYLDPRFCHFYVAQNHIIFMKIYALRSVGYIIGYICIFNIFPKFISMLFLIQRDYWRQGAKNLHPYCWQEFSNFEL